MLSSLEMKQMTNMAVEQTCSYLFLLTFKYGTYIPYRNTTLTGELPQGYFKNKYGSASGNEANEIWN